MSSFKNYLMNDKEYKQTEQELMSFEDIPKGEYPLRVIEAKKGDPKFGDSANLTLKVMDGKYKGRVAFVNLYFDFDKSKFFNQEDIEKKEKGVRIAKHNLTSLAKIKGYFNDVPDLKDVSFDGYLSPWKNKDGKTRYSLSVKSIKNEKVTADNATIVLSPTKEFEDIPF
jgi:hypothetical protein